MAITVGGSSITFPDATTQTTAYTGGGGGGGTVTSVATGNGLSGGTITTSGTLTIACPTANSVGSYAFAVTQYGAGSVNRTFGSNYAGGNGYDSIGNGPVTIDGNTGLCAIVNNAGLTGTWKWLAGDINITVPVTGAIGIACRVV